MKNVLPSVVALMVGFAALSESVAQDFALITDYTNFSESGNMLNSASHDREQSFTVSNTTIRIENESITTGVAGQELFGTSEFASFTNEGYRLQINLEFIDWADNPGNNARVGLMTSSTIPAGGPTSGDVRSDGDYIYWVYQAASLRAGAYTSEGNEAEGSFTSVGPVGEAITGLYMERWNGVWNLGYMDENGVDVFVTTSSALSFAPTTDGSCIGLYSDMRSDEQVCVLADMSYGELPPVGIVLSDRQFDYTLPSSSVIASLSAKLFGTPASATFSITPGYQDGDLFAINDDTNLVLNADFSSATNGQQYTIQIVADAGGTLGTNDFVLTALSPKLEIALDSSTFLSGVSIGSTVGTLSADYVAIETIPADATFSLASGEGDADNGLFGISTSNLVTSADFTGGTYTNGQTFSVRVQAIGEGLTNQVAFTLTMTKDDDLDGLPDGVWSLLWRDDFSSDSTADYIYSRVRDTGTEGDPGIIVTGGVLDYGGQLSCAAVFAHESNQLAVGEALFIDVLDIPGGSSQRKGLVVCSANELPTAVDGSTRSNLIYMATDRNKSRFLTESFVSTNGTTTTSGFGSWDDVKGVYIERTTTDEFSVGWLGTDLVQHEIKTWTNAVFSSGCYIGVWTESGVSALNTQFDNLTIAESAGPTVTPNIVSMTVSGSTATLTWDSESGVTYKILRKDALTAGSWSEVKTGIVGGDPTTTDSDTSATGDQAFYRIEGN